MFARHRKNLITLFSTLVLLAIVFSCRGIGVNVMGVERGEASVPQQHACCGSSIGTYSETHGAIALAPQNQLNEELLLLLGSTFIIAFCTDSLEKIWNSYIRVARRKYGGFVFLNYFTPLFADGILNAKVF